MRAFQIDGPGVVTEISAPVPEIAEDEALIRIIYSGICATDMEILGGEMALIRDGSIRYPVRFGHEYSGVIEKVGSAVTKFKPGDHVLSDSGIACGKCPACARGNYQGCKDARSVGTVHCWDGSFAEYMHVPERHLYRLPDDLDMMEAALIEPSGIALEGLKRGGNLEGKTVVVVGTGTIGMTAVAMARHYKPAKVILVGRTDGKLEIGRKLGADVTINARREDVVEAVQRETNGLGAEMVLETSGNLDAVNQCVLSACYGGTVSFIGFYESGIDAFPIDVVVSRKITVGGVMGDYGTPAQVIRILEKDKIDLKPIISHVITMDELPGVMMNPGRLQGDRIKVMVRIAEDYT